MVPEDRKPSPERDETDESLRLERQKTDQALLQKRAALERNADAVVDRARDIADSVLSEARDKADQKLDQEESPAGTRETVGEERVAEDAALQSERAAADESLRREREEHALALHRLLPLEREKTVRLVGDLVDVTSIDAGKLEVIPSSQDLCALAIEAMATFEPVAAAKRISLVLESAEPSILADFDHDRMMQVFANLLTNAIKFSPEGGKVSIRVERAEGRALCRVGDDGPGIPGNMLELVFERFWQAGNNDRRGLGLGLYISRCIVEARGGTIWAESGMGEGSRLFFTLPTALG